MASVSDVVSVYAEWGYMDPADWKELSEEYVSDGGICDVIFEGTLIDAELLHCDDDDMPVVFALPCPVNEWTSTFEVKAWDSADAPDIVWDMLERAQEARYYDDDVSDAEVRELASELREF